MYVYLAFEADGRKEVKYGGKVGIFLSAERGLNWDICIRALGDAFLVSKIV